MLLRLLAVLTLMANYASRCATTRETVAGWDSGARKLTMAISTVLTTWFRPRALRHVWLLVGVVGLRGRVCGGCRRWMALRAKSRWP